MMIKKQDANVPRIRNLLDHAILKNGIQKIRETSLAYKKSAHQNAQEQRRISFLGDQSQDDGDNRWD